MEKPTFFLYARKSTDVEDKQVLSIEAQLAELRSFAKLEGLEIAEEFVEKKSAKMPGRPIFNDMMNRLERKEAVGIIAWHPDRLARNSVDGGRVVYLLDCEHISMLKFPTFWFENTSQGKFMLSIAFGQSKYYVDSLSENTKRGLRQKVRRGEYPGLAPMGYINDSRTKTVVIDKNKAPAITAAFEYYAEGEHRLEDVANFLAKRGIKARGGKPLHRTRITCILSNPLYTGLFQYAGKMHKGTHQPIVAKNRLMKCRKSLQEKNATLETSRIGWLEPMREWIQVAENLSEIVRDGTLLKKKVAAKEIFGSNLCLRARELVHSPPENCSVELLSPYFVLSSLRAKRGSVTENHVLGRRRRGRSNCV
jgi:DNA invertase Pin-like site-specific DNA recombinase